MITEAERQIVADEIRAQQVGDRIAAAIGGFLDSAPVALRNLELVADSVAHARADGATPSDWLGIPEVRKTLDSTQRLSVAIDRAADSVELMNLPKTQEIFASYMRRLANASAFVNDIAR